MTDIITQNDACILQKPLMQRSLLVFKPCSMEPLTSPLNVNKHFLKLPDSAMNSDVSP